MVDAMQENTSCPPPISILLFDVLTNIGWIAANFLTAPFVGSKGNLDAVLLSKSFIIGALIALINPFVKQKLLFPSIMNWREDHQKAQRNILRYENLLLGIPILIAFTVFHDAACVADQHCLYHCGSAFDFCTNRSI